MSKQNSVEQRVLKFVRGRRYRPMTAKEMAEALSIPDAEHEDFFGAIKELELAGELVEVKKKRLADPGRVDLMIGTLLCNPRGFGFIRPVREIDGEDIYVSGENMSSALEGDLVVARVPTAYRKAKAERARTRKRDRAEVKIVSVLKRARTHIVGTFRRERKVRYVVPDNPRLFRDVIIAAEDTGSAKNNDKVRARITAWPTRHLGPEGEIVEVFGKRGNLEAERQSVVSEFGLRDTFPSEVLRAAKRIPRNPTRRDLKSRTDLTDELIITIDPDDARDFDDAVNLKRLPDGGWELGVHIADVAHYVKPDDAIDKEALARGTSVYLPGQVIPMLPEALSNGVCSLRPDEIHLTKSVRMRFTAKGKPTEAQVFNSYIKSARRFTYKEVERVIKGGSLSKKEKRLQKKLLEMYELSELLRARRVEEGMLELALPEAHIVTDEQGNTKGIELLTGDESHRLIEQFMLAANEAVANELIRRKLPYICRAHDEPSPEAIREFRDTIRPLGFTLPTPGTRKQIQNLLNRARNQPYESVIHYLFLRSMMQAEYSAEDRPHYAIGAIHYLHFTSPIRRYPDLLVHRILDEATEGSLKKSGRRAWWKENLPVWADHSTEREKNAEMAERSLTDRRLRAHIAEQTEPMDAIIIAVENYGMRVQLRDSLLHGVVRMSALSDGFYRLDRQSAALVASGKKRYRVGQVIKVRVGAYDEFKHQIEFVPVKANAREK